MKSIKCGLGSSKKKLREVSLLTVLGGIWVQIWLLVCSFLWRMDPVVCAQQQGGGGGME